MSKYILFNEVHISMFIDFRFSIRLPFIIFDSYLFASHQTASGSFVFLSPFSSNGNRQSHVFWGGQDALLQLHRSILWMARSQERGVECGMQTLGALALTLRKYSWPNTISSIPYFRIFVFLIFVDLPLAIPAEMYMVWQLSAQSGFGHS